MIIDYNKKRFFPEDPTICPWCHHSNQPTLRWQVETNDNEGTIHVISAWLCTYSKCNRIYIARHDFDKSKAEVDFVFKGYLNGYPKGPDWPHPIIELRSKFQNIYLQSLKAEHQGLDEIAGMGYRKALEFLVKDWAIQNIAEDDPEKDNKINTVQSSFLGRVIDEFYDGDLQAILKRATWLGNDEAHYIRLFNDMPIDVLKELIALIMVELDREYKKKLYIETISSRNL